MTGTATGTQGDAKTRSRPSARAAVADALAQTAVAMDAETQTLSARR